MDLLARRNRCYRALHAGLNDPLTVVWAVRDIIAKRGPREEVSVTISTGRRCDIHKLPDFFV